jgi:uncharacterized protein HemX
MTAVIPETDPWQQPAAPVAAQPSRRWKLASLALAVALVVAAATGVVELTALRSAHSATAAAKAATAREHAKLVKTQADLKTMDGIAQQSSKDLKAAEDHADSISQKAGASFTKCLLTIGKAINDEGPSDAIDSTCNQVYADLGESPYNFPDITG